MIDAALVLFVVAALFGIYMATRIFRNALPPVAAVAGHGLFAATGLLILLYAALSPPAPAPVVIVAAILLVIAALGGFVMVSYQARKALPPKALVIVHASAAVIGVGALLAHAFNVA
jgi:hypothetical protein